MGLYLSKLIIEHHMGGTIRVNNYRSGTEVSILLPLRLSEQRPDEEEGP